jgi:hypothetical protein
MNLSRLVFAIVAGFCLLRPAPLAAQESAPPFVMEKQYSADQTITTKDGMVLQTKTFVDGDKMRSNVTMKGMAMSTIVRKDKKKIYQVMEAQKMVMEMDYDEAKFMKSRTAGAFGPSGKFEVIGPDTVDGIACTKYKVISDDQKKTFFFWIDATKKVPVQMTDAEGTFTAKWKNYKVGPQDPSLFELPEGYTVMPMPVMPEMPAGA